MEQPSGISSSENKRNVAHDRMSVSRMMQYVKYELGYRLMTTSATLCLNDMASIIIMSSS